MNATNATYDCYRAKYKLTRYPGSSHLMLYLDFNRSAAGVRAVVVVIVVVDDDNGDRILVFDGCATFTFRFQAPLHPLDE